MASLWFYTSAGKQQDPVSLAELRALADNGTLKASDMVWTEGMAKWVKAGTMKEVFGETPLSESPPPESTPKKGSPELAEPVSEVEGEPTPRKKKLLDVDDDRPRSRRRFEDEEDDRPRRGRGRSSSGSGINPWAVVIGVVVSIFLICGGMAFVAVTAVRDAARNLNIGGDAFFFGRINEVPGLIEIPDKGEHKFATDLPEDVAERRVVTFKQGLRYEIKVDTFQCDQNCDVDLGILDPRGNLLTQDIDPAKDCILTLIPAETGQFKVDVRNLGPGNAKSNVTIRELPGNPLPKKIDAPKKELPAGVRGGSALFKGEKAIEPGQEFAFKLMTSKRGQQVRVQVHQPAAPAIEFTVSAAKLSDNKEFATARAANLNASITLDQIEPDEIVWIRIRNPSDVPITSYSVIH